MTNLRAKAVMERWSGHGEGGTIAKIVIEGGDYGLYESSPQDLARAEADAARINAALTAVETQTIDQLHAAVKTAQELAAARLQEIDWHKATVRQLKEAIYWALGERDDFKDEPDPLAGKYRRHFWWRTELRQRSSLRINGQPDEPLYKCDRCDTPMRMGPKVWEYQCRCHDEPTDVKLPEGGGLNGITDHAVYTAAAGAVPARQSGSSGVDPSGERQCEPTAHHPQERSDRLRQIANLIESRPVLGHWPAMMAAPDAEFLRSIALEN